MKLNDILSGCLEFFEEFEGKLITETMLIKGQDYLHELRRIADFLRELRPFKAYIAVPTRPPTEPWVKPVEEVLSYAFCVLSEKLGYGKVEYLTGYEDSSFPLIGEIREEILAVTSVHPLREGALKGMLRTANAGWGLVEELLRNGELIKLNYGGITYYVGGGRETE